MGLPERNVVKAFSQIDGWVLALGYSVDGSALLDDLHGERCSFPEALPDFLSVNELPICFILCVRYLKGMLVCLTTCSTFE